MATLRRSARTGINELGADLGGAGPRRRCKAWTARSGVPQRRDAGPSLLGCACGASCAVSPSRGGSGDAGAWPGAGRSGADREGSGGSRHRLAGGQGRVAQRSAVPGPVGGVDRRGSDGLPVAAYDGAERHRRTRWCAAGLSDRAHAGSRVVQPRPGARGRIGHGALAAVGRVRVCKCPRLRCWR